MNSPAKSASAPIRVMIIDDHEIFRTGLEQIIRGQPDMIFGGGAGSSADAMAIIRTSPPNVVILDLSLKGRSGIDVLKDARALSGSARFLVLTVHDENLFAERALRAGASGFIMKEEGAGRVLEGIREVAAGRFFFSSSVSQKILGTMSGRAREDDRLPMDRLTDRELVVFELFGRGLNTRQIAADLNLSQKTVEAHRENIKRKLGIADGQELLRRAVLWVQDLNVS